jgi:diguanylate cyclase (GGDEF)-like protein
VFLRIYCAMSGVLTLDTLLFVTLSFADHAEYSRILFSGIVGKLVVALIYAVVLTIYLRAGEPAARDAVIPALEPRDLLSLLTYREKFEALRAQATRDALTQAYNRGFFEEMLPRELALARRDGVPVGLLAIDVDHFKRINDQRGHSAGDAVLGGLAATLASAVRGTDLVCRYGGDEFVIILRGTDTAQAAAVAEKIRALLAHAPLLPDGGSARTVTVTIGAAAFPADADGARELFEAADRRLLRAKLAGRDRVVSEDHTLE